MPNISNVVQHLIGVSFLEEQDENRLLKEWNFRFQEELSVWTHAAAGEGEFPVMQRIFQTAMQHGHESMAGMNLVLAGFYDIRQENALEQAQLLKAVAKMLSNVGAIVSVSMQFGYVGNIPSPTGEILRERVNMIAQENIGRLCLIARNAFANLEGNNWRSAVILLDLLRRDSAPDAMLPLPGAGAVNAVGYLKYSEYNQVRRDRLTKELEEVNKLLDSQGSGQLRTCITDALNEIDVLAEKRYPVNGAAHPIHPGMIVEPGFMRINIRSAQRGNNQEYNAAVSATKAAVEETELLMRARMTQEFVPDDARAKDMMRRILEESGAGYKMVIEMDDLLTRLNLTVDPERQPGVLLMPYSEKGHSETIDIYLRESRRYSAYLCKVALLNQLVKALEALKPEYQAKIPELEERQKSLNTKLAMLPNWSTYTNTVVGAGTQMETCFHPFMTVEGVNSATMKYIIWREQADGNELTSKAPNYCYYIDKSHGSLKHVDDARVKALHVFFSTCSEAALKDLIH